VNGFPPEFWARRHAPPFKLKEVVLAAMVLTITMRQARMFSQQSAILSGAQQQTSSTAPGVK
jgi:hypothetical protein